MVPKITLKEIYRDVFRRSTLVSIPELSELFEVPGSEFSKWEIFYTIVRDALNEFEKYYPLTRLQKLYIEVDSNSRLGKYYPNFEAYLNNVLDEESIVLDIASCQGLAYTAYVNSQYPLRNFRFDNGQFTDFWHPSGIYWGNCICKRPFIEDYIRDEGVQHKEPTDKCAVYFIQANLDTQSTIFRNQVFCEVCRYIFTIKKNFALQNMPIELYQGLEEDFSRVNEELRTIYQQAHRSSPWLI